MTMQPLLELRQVSKRFDEAAGPLARAGNLIARAFGAAPLRRRAVHAVDGVDLSVHAGKVVGLVGESGCGKSTLGRIAVGLQPPSSGERLWKGMDLGLAEPAQRRREQLAVQMVFQDPYASLNPRRRVADAVGEAPVVHGLVERAQHKEYVASLLAQVGLDPGLGERFPHQLSGGQRARAGIARALAVRPQFLVCDESVAALDVSVQAQVLNLFMRLREELGLTYLFISHDLSVVKHVSDRVAVMYLGRIVESAPADELFAAPAHPYTRALLAAAPTLVARKREHVAVRGEIPSPLAPPAGCHFHPRCPHAVARCRSEVPLLRPLAARREVACHLHEQG